MNNLLKPKNVLYLHPTADLYGGTKILLEIIEFLPREQFNPIVILPNSGPLEKVLSQLQVEYYVHPITVVRRGSVKGFALVKFLLAILPNIIWMAIFIRAHKIDLVHTQTMVVLTGAFAAKLAGKPHIWHIHEIVSAEFPKLWGFYCRLIVNLSNRIVCISNVTAEQFPDRTKVRIIPNGIDLQAFAIGPVQGLKKEGSINIGVIGRISPRKGQAYLLDAFIDLLRRQKENSPHLFIVGDIFTGYEYYLQELKNKVSEAGLEVMVTFTGFIEDMTTIYSLLDIVVVPSILPEGFGLVVLEAMASHLPVIATDHGGPLETIEPNISGLLVPHDDVSLLADALDFLISHPEERERLGEGGYQRVKQVFSIEITTNLVMQTYDDILIA